MTRSIIYIVLLSSSLLMFDNYSDQFMSFCNVVVVMFGDINMMSCELWQLCFLCHPVVVVVVVVVHIYICLVKSLN